MATAPKKPAASPVSVAAEALEAAGAPTAVVVTEAVKAFEAPVASLVEMQGNLRSAFEKGLSESRAVYVKAKTVADEAVGAIETSYAAARAGVVAINAKTFDALRANVEANFDFVKSALATKNVADYVTLQSEFARQQLDAIAVQTKELNALAQRLANETAEPIKEQVAKTFKIAV